MSLLFKHVLSHPKLTPLNVLSHPKSLVGVRMPKLNPEKSQWVAMTPSGLKVFISLMGVQIPKLNNEKSQWGVTIRSGL